MPSLVPFPAATFALRPVPCASCPAKTTLIARGSGVRAGARAKCLPCRFREALESVRDGVAWEGRFVGRFDTGSPLVSRSALNLTREHGLGRIELDALLRQHARGDFGLIGRYDPAQDTREARDLGPLADRETRNTIAIADRRGDVLSARPLGPGETLYIWTFLGRSPATIFFAGDDDIEVY
jgi:hypothetical protein